MDLPRLADRLGSNLEVFHSLLAHVDAEQAHWKPRPEKWSMVEVVCHLADEEREDFRRRVDLTLHRFGEPWPRIDPPAWAVERRYNERELSAALADFSSERGRSVEWLRRLATPDLDASYDHPSGIRISVGDLLVSWQAHDLIHIRQITRLHYEYLVAHAGEYSPDYAGDW